MYVVKIGEKRESQHRRRDEAVKAARRLSRHRKASVRILRDGGVERLVYHDGALVEGALVTPDRQRRGDLFS